MSCLVPGAAGVSCNAPVVKHNQQADTNTRLAKAVSDRYVTDDPQICNPLLSFSLARGFMSEDTHMCKVSLKYLQFIPYEKICSKDTLLIQCGLKTETNSVYNHALYLLHQADYLHFQQVLTGIPHKSF